MVKPGSLPKGHLSIIDHPGPFFCKLMIGDVSNLVRDAGRSPFNPV